MTTDYPDWTRLMQLIGADIMMPIDIQGAYIMMPVDIQAQYITLDIDIVAQTIGNIAVDLKAQSIGNIGIDIKANTLGNLTIDVEAQSIGIYLKADWEVLQGHDKNIVGTGTEVAADSYLSTTYEVTTGKTFYICGLSFSIHPHTATDYDHFIRGAFELVNQTDNLYYAYGGGESGGGISFSKPIAVPADKTVALTTYNKTNLVCDIAQSFWGYEI